MKVPTMKESSPEKKLSWIRSQIIGGNAEFNSPVGKRRITYADTTATSRSLRFIEDYIVTNVLPYYGNTHTGDSYVGQHSTKMVKEASEYIKKCLRAKEDDAILFCGSGATSAIKRLQEVMGFAIAPILRAKVLDALRGEEKWVVFVGPYEHHSNLLSWRQSLAEVIEIGLTEDGCLIDMESLRTQLERYERTNRPMLGSFSACSNVTGIMSDTRALARLLHRHGAFACFDFAASGPYVEINMKSGEEDGYDAVFISAHKFIGGPGTPGILLMNKILYRLDNFPPSTCGGGTVSYVNGFDEEDTLYLDTIEERENAGTPQIIQTVRAALSFWIKEYIGYETIKCQESYYMTTAYETLGKINNIQILGQGNVVDRLAILSFLVYPLTNENTNSNKAENTTNIRDQKPLHGRFVAKLLNDLFGVQARGGCACAGPYGHHLLNVDETYSLVLRSLIQQGYEGVKPASARISFPYYMSKEEFNFVLTAIKFVASYGHQFLQLYDIDWKNGNWTFNEKNYNEILDVKHRATNSFDVHRVLIMKLSGLKREMKLRYNNKQVKDSSETCVEDKSVTTKYASYIDTATCIVSLLPKYPKQKCAPDALQEVDLPFKI